MDRKGNMKNNRSLWQTENRSRSSQISEPRDRIERPSAKGQIEDSDAGARPTTRMLKLKLGGVTTGSRAIKFKENTQTQDVVHKRPRASPADLAPEDISRRDGKSKRRQRLILQSNSDDEQVDEIRAPVRTRVQSLEVAVRNSPSNASHGMHEPTHRDAEVALGSPSLDQNSDGGNEVAQASLRFKQISEVQDKGHPPEPAKQAKPGCTRKRSSAKKENVQAGKGRQNSEGQSSLGALVETERWTRSMKSEDERVIAKCPDSDAEVELVEFVEEIKNEGEELEICKQIKIGGGDEESEDEADEEAKSSGLHGEEEDKLSEGVTCIEAVPLTARQRAMLQPDEANFVEYPEGLSETRNISREETQAERLLKREEAARKRRLHIEKHARDSQASAIQKILGQDSSRKRREEKILKQRLDAHMEREAAAAEGGINRVRLSAGPSGTVVTWSKDACLPPFFNAPTPRYPGPREKCAGPECPNVYRYRDSKTKLPLCSLHCYKCLQCS